MKLICPEKLMAIGAAGYAGCLEQFKLQIKQKESDIYNDRALAY